MQTFKQFLKEDGPVPDHAKNPFHSTLEKHGFTHKSSSEGPYKGSEWHHYEHPELGHVKATVYPKGHGFGETHWSHDHPNPDNRHKKSSAGRTAKSLNDYLSHGSDRTTAKIRGVLHRGF